MTLLQLGVVAPGLNNFIAQSGPRCKKVFYFMSLQPNGIIVFKGATLDLSDGSEPMVSIKTPNLQMHEKLKIDVDIQKVLKRQFPIDGFAKFATPSAAATWVKSYASGRKQTADGWNCFYYGTIRMDHFRNQYPKAFLQKKIDPVYSKKGYARQLQNKSRANIKVHAATEPPAHGADKTKKPTKEPSAIDHSLLDAIALLQDKPVADVYYLVPTVTGSVRNRASKRRPEGKLN